MALLENEKELENYIMQEFGRLNLWGHKQAILKQQVQLQPYGIADITAFNVCGYGYQKIDKKYVLNILIIETKKGIIDYNAVGQICKYKTAFEHSFMKRPISKKFDIQITGALIGDSIELNSDLCFLFNNIDWLKVYTYDLNLKYGLSFIEKRDFYRNSKGFSNPLKPIIKQILKHSEFKKEIKEWYDMVSEYQKKKYRILKRKIRYER